jgi:N-acetylmuramoyl-L-alanine amidase
MRRVIFSLLVWLAFDLLPAPAAAQDLQGLSFCLDPGHSRRENRGAFGYSEAEKALRVAKNLREYLRAAGADTVVLTRETDQDSVSLPQRVDIANAAGVSWFQSIHSDAGTLSESANSILILINETADGTVRWPGEADVAGELLSDLMSRTYRIGTRGVWTDRAFARTFGTRYTTGLFVLNNTTMPGLLSEGGFHTVPSQNLKNMNAEFKRLTAKGKWLAYLDYYGATRPPVNTVAGIIREEDRGRPVNGVIAITSDGQRDTTDTFESLFFRYCQADDDCANGFYFFEDVPSGEVSITFTHPDFYDTTLTVSVSDTFFTFVDPLLISKIPPRVVASTPADGDTAASILDPRRLEFSRAVDRASVEQALSIVPEVAINLSWEDDDHVLLISSTEPLPFDTEFMLTIEATARDRRGHPLDGNGDGIGGDAFQLSFKTAARDLFPPALLSAFPETGAERMPLDLALTFVYNEPVSLASVTSDRVAIFDENQEQVPAEVEVVNVGNRSIVTLFPSSLLLPNAFYTAFVNPGIEDLFGNKTTSTLTLDFGTVPVAPQLSVLESFDAGLGNWWQPEQSGSTTGIVEENTAFERETTRVYRTTGSIGSARLRYEWRGDIAPGGGLIRLHTPEGTPVRQGFSPESVVQIHIFGDGSGNLFRFHVDESTGGGGEVSPWFVIDWLGWRQVQWDLQRDGVGSWLASSDGRLTGTLTIDSIQLGFGEGAARSGVLYFDDLRISDIATKVVQTPETRIPVRFALLPNFPNPFSAGAAVSGEGTTIRYEITAAGRQKVRLQVYDLLGREVRTLVDGWMPPGKHQVVWDGRDSAGLPARSGVYLIRLQVGPATTVRKVTLLR